MRFIAIGVPHVPDFAVKTAFTAVDGISPAFNRMGGAATRFEKTASRAFMAVGAFVSGYLVNSFVEAASQAERLNTGFKSVFGGDAANQMQFVREETKRLGLELTTSADAYKSIAAAAKGTAISNSDVQQTFLGVSEAAAALQLSSEQSQGALLAISQIISKGKVSMEELRGQLGERIPGAMQIAARSMGVTTAELEKLVASGIPAEKFIPRFAAQMRKEFGPAAMDAANSFNASRNRFNNMVFDFKVGIGSVILPMLNDLMTAFTPALNLMVDFFKENQKGISAIVKLLPWVVGGFLAWKFAIMAMKIPMAINTALTWGAQIGIVALTIAEYAGIAATWLYIAATVALGAAFFVLTSPIFLVIAAVALLAGAAYLIYKNWEPVKAFFIGMWDGIVSGFNSAIEWIISKFTAVVDWISKKWNTVKDIFGFGDNNQTMNVNGNAPNQTEVNGKYSSNDTININNSAGVNSEVKSTNRQAKINFNNPGYNLP